MYKGASRNLQGREERRGSLGRSPREPTSPVMKEHRRGLALARRVRSAKVATKSTRLIKHSYIELSAHAQALGSNPWALGRDRHEATIDEGHELRAAARLLGAELRSRGVDLEELLHAQKKRMRGAATRWRAAASARGR